MFANLHCLGGRWFIVFGWFFEVQRWLLANKWLHTLVVHGLFFEALQKIPNHTSISRSCHISIDLLSWDCSHHRSITMNIKIKIKTVQNWFNLMEKKKENMIRSNEHDINRKEWINKNWKSWLLFIGNRFLLLQNHFKIPFKNMQLVCATSY